MSELKEEKELKKVIKQKQDMFAQAALHKVETMKELVVDEPEIPEQESPAGTHEEFSRMLSLAQHVLREQGEQMPVEVTPEYFKVLVKNNPTKYLTYGNPGVKVYVAGTREQIEKEENMDAVKYANHVGLRK